MWNAIVSWLQWLIFDWKKQDSLFLESSKLRERITIAELEQESLEFKQKELLDRLAALEDWQKAQMEATALLAAEIAEKQKPNARFHTRNWSNFRNQVQGA